MEILKVLLSFVFQALLVVAVDTNASIPVAAEASPGSGTALLSACVSLSIELSSFPDYAGKYVAAWLPPRSMRKLANVAIVRKLINP